MQKQEEWNGCHQNKQAMEWTLWALSGNGTVTTESFSHISQGLLFVKYTNKLHIYLYVIMYKYIIHLPHIITT